MQDVSYSAEVRKAEDEEIENTVAHLNHAMEKVQCKRRFQNEIIIKDWETFDNTDYEKLLSCGYVSENYRKMHIEEGETFKSLYFMNLDKTKDEITEAAKKSPGRRRMRQGIPCQRIPER